MSKKITQDIVDRTFMVRNGTCGSYYEPADVDKIKETVHQKFGVTLSNSETVDFWRWRCEQWDGSWFGVSDRDSDLIEEYFPKFVQYVGAEDDEEDETVPDTPALKGVKVTVKDAEGIPWEIELDPEYHSQLLVDIESQVPEERTGGTLKIALEYDPQKIWGMRRLDGV